MLYHILYEFLYPLNHLWAPLRVLNVFQYITFRTAYASLTALLISLLLGPWLITRLREFQIGQHIREEGPKSHQKKAGTPTMGGVLILISIIIPTLLWVDLRYTYVWIALTALVGYGFIGFFDDYAKIVKRQNLGLSGKRKLLLQFLLAFVLATILAMMHREGSFSTTINFPFIKQFQPDLTISSFLKNPWTYPLAFVPFFLFVGVVIVGLSNAVNLTDGLDG